MFRLAFLSWLGITAVGLAQTCELSEDVQQTLQRCISGVTVEKSQPGVTDPTRTYFRVTIEQPIDHANPSGGTFKQRLIVAHRGYDEPMVLQTSGYNIFGAAPAYLTKTFNTNQIQVEHRFFDPSSPSPKDWSKLDIKQSAHDFHRIVEKFKSVYKKAWVNTGASKGGMTSVYHRKFFPADLDGTVADVAPQSYSKEDSRYITFVENVGGDEYKDCRLKMMDLQKHLLVNRTKFQKTLSGGEFKHLGGLDLAYEHAVQEMPFYFWQYRGPTDPFVGCDRIPTPSSSDAAVVAYLQSTANLSSNYSDSALARFLPYFYQAATELGAPGNKRDHLSGLLLYEFQVEQYAPKGVPLTYSDKSMREVEAWVKNDSEKVMYVYGQFDPWSAGAFPEKSTGDNHTFWAPAENHRSNIGYLSADDKAAALAIVGRWMGKQAVVSPLDEDGPTLDQIEFEYRSRHRLF